MLEWQQDEDTEVGQPTPIANVLPRLQPPTEPEPVPVPAQAEAEADPFTKVDDTHAKEEEAVEEFARRSSTAPSENDASDLFHSVKSAKKSEEEDEDDEANSYQAPQPDHFVAVRSRRG